jgi:hypothetical protein
VLVAAGFLTLGAVVGLNAGTASAAPVTNPSCPLKNFCMWQDANFGKNFNTTHYFYDYNNVVHNQWVFVGNNANDQASSFYANKAFTTDIGKDFIDAHTAPNQWACVLGGHSRPDLSNERWPDGSGMNDTISSIFLWESSGQGGCPEVF